MKEGGGSPTAEGDFKGKGKTDAEKEATEVPEKERDKGDKGGGDKSKDDEGGKKPKGEGEKDNEKPEKDVKEPDLGGE